MIGFDNVASVLSVFTKLIARLEKIREKQKREMEAQSIRIAEAKEKMEEAKREDEAAQKAIENLSKFME